MIKIRLYCLPSGRVPFTDWFKKLDGKEKAYIQRYLQRLAEGGSIQNLKYLSDGIWELKISFGPGYRIYYGHLSKDIILILLGGTKRSQLRDIDRANTYWSDYAKKNS